MQGIRALVLLLLWCFPSYAFTDDLLSLYQEAVEHDPRISTAAALVGIGKARQKQAVGLMLPQISLYSNWSGNHRREIGNGLPSETFDGEKHSLTLRQTIFDASKFYGWKRSQKLADQSVAAERDIKYQLIIDIVDRYFETLQSKDNLQIVLRQKQEFKSRLDQVTKLYEMKHAKITDLYEVRARFDKVLADEIEAMRAVQIARQGLSELTNSEVGSLNRLKEKIEFVELKNPLDVWLQKVKSNSQSLIALEKAIDAEKRGLLEQKSRYAPVVELQLSAQTSDIGFESSAQPETETGVAGITLNIPLFSGGNTTGRVREARYRLQIAKSDYELEYRKQSKEVRDFFLGVNSSVQRIKALETATRSAAKSLEAMDKGFKYGIVTVVDVLNAQHNESQAQSDLNQSKYEYVRNRFKLMRLTGELEAELSLVNGWLEPK